MSFLPSSPKWLQRPSSRYKVRALANRLSDAERFAQQVGFAVREMQKQKVKALQNGQVKSAAPGRQGSRPSRHCVRL